VAATETDRRAPAPRGAVSAAALAAAAAAAAASLAPPAARAENLVEVHGTYFREASTRVVQPMLSVSADLPYGFDVRAHGLVDAITSASIAQGASQDELFTETRKEASLGVGKSWGHTRVGLTYRESREPDYISQTAGVSVQTGVWGESGLLGFNVAYANDTLGPNLNFRLKTVFAGVGYEQAITPTLLAQAVYEAYYHEGFLGNVYLRVPNLGMENPPGKRLRHAFALRVATYRPALRAGAQLHVRLYVDQDFGLQLHPWGVMSNTVEARVFKELGRDVEVRLSYRVHAQGAAKFWCNTDPSRGGRTDCYGPFPRYHSADPKLGDLATYIPEAKLFWDLRLLEGVPGLALLARGTLDVSYGYFFQSTRYGGAHLLQLGYALPF
jgi:hypothetical protein